MSSKERSPQEIERILLEDVNKPESWGKAVRVPPSNSRRPVSYQRSRHLEQAAVLYLASIVHRLGAEATVPFSPTCGADIAVLQPSGRTLTIQVKTLPGTRDWHVDTFDARRHHFIAFVCYKDSWQNPDPASVPDVLIWPSQRLQAIVSRQKSEVVSFEFLASKLDPAKAWRTFRAELAA